VLEVDELGQKRVKLRNNIMRWRHAPGADGQPSSARQSNARFVKWSDGSVQVRLAPSLAGLALGRGGSVCGPAKHPAGCLPHPSSLGGGAC
jgi:hypothetical protein